MAFALKVGLTLFFPFSPVFFDRTGYSLSHPFSWFIHSYFSLRAWLTVCLLIPPPRFPPFAHIDFFSFSFAFSHALPESPQNFLRLLLFCFFTGYKGSWFWLHFLFRLLQFLIALDVLFPVDAFSWVHFLAIVTQVVGRAPRSLMFFPSVPSHFPVYSGGGYLSFLPFLFCLYSFPLLLIPRHFLPLACDFPYPPACISFEQFFLSYPVQALRNLFSCLLLKFPHQQRWCPVRFYFLPFTSSSSLNDVVFRRCSPILF